MAIYRFVIKKMKASAAAAANFKDASAGNISAHQAK